MTDFFKPTKGKLLIFFLIFLIGSGTLYSVFGCAIGGDSARSFCNGTMLKFFIYVFIWPSFIFKFSVTLSGIISILLSIFYWYILACLIVFIKNLFNGNLGKGSKK